jgi:acyl-CoA synthetase (AMP-forming)/AMP-acid ligase II
MLERDGPVPGPPLFCTRVRVGGEGEIEVAGPTVAPAARGPGGWLRTGDLGTLDERGRLHVSGRLAETIISGGENVAPAEVEAVLEAHPDVLEAAVLARADASWGEAVIAIVVPRPGHAPGVDALRGHCAQLLAPYKVPREVIVREEPLPRTPSGKLARRKLR